MSTTILVGDRVKATNTKTGDLAEFTVTQLNQHAYGYSLESKTNFFAPDGGWTFEVIEPPKPTITEQYRALEPGTRFSFTHTTVQYTKIDDRYFVMHYDVEDDIQPAVRDWSDYSYVAAEIEVIS